MNSEFPKNPFPIVNPEDFDKNTKKKFSEDYVEENLRSQGWNVYEPFVDKGYDRLITKKIIINGSTKYIKRFLQIKTRRLEYTESQKEYASLQKAENYIKTYKVENTKPIKKNGRYIVKVRKDYIGVTIKPKDIVTDPRVVFCFFCDSVEDILFFPIWEWISFMSINSPKHFSNIGFKQGDGKFNDTYYHKIDKKWTWKWKREIYLDKFVNEKGLKLIEDSEIENNFEDLQTKIADFKKNKIFNLDLNNPGRLRKLAGLESTAKNINNFIKIKNKSKKELTDIHKVNNAKIKTLDDKTQQSIKTYFAKNEKKILEV